MKTNYQLEPVLDFDMRHPLYAFRTVPIRIGHDKKTFLSFYSANHSIDASPGMFTYPTDNHRIVVWSETGEIIWKQALHMGNIPSMAFGNFWACDLNRDGIDEIYLMYNRDELHPFKLREYCMRVLNARDGSLLYDHEWPYDGPEDTMGMTFRRIIFSGFVKGEPVLIRWQGVYKDIYVKAFNGDMSLRWERFIPRDAGTRASHCYPVCDIKGDGVDCFFLGQRCISMDDGRDLFCCDEKDWNGHVDMVQPILERASGRWYVYVNRETLPDQGPRVNLYDDHGNRVWGAVEKGHIHKGWAARIGENGELIATACAIGGQTKTKTERLFTGVTEYCFEAMTGKPVVLPYKVFDTAPVDVNGDTLSEIIQDINGEARLIDRRGNLIAELGGRVAMNTHILDMPGEQIITFNPNGHVKIWADLNAKDTPEAAARYQNHTYRMNQMMPTYDYMLGMFGGI